MNITEILAKCDHTLLLQGSTWEEIKGICDDGIKFGCASVCIPASFVKQAKEYVDLLMPDVVIPMHYMCEGYVTQFDDLDDFLDLFEKKDIEYAENSELEFDRTDFDGERTRVIVPIKVQ